MAWCLIKPLAQKFREGLKDGSIDPNKLAQMKTSEERRNFLAKFVGEENAANVNGLFETKLMLKNQQRGYVSWAKRVLTPGTRQKAQFIDKVRKLDTFLTPTEEESFLHDAIAQKLGVAVSEEEARFVKDSVEKIDALKNKVDRSSSTGDKTRLEYGTAQKVFDHYVAKLKYNAEKLSFKEEPLRTTFNTIWKTIPDISQTIQTSYDNSVWFRNVVGALATPRYSKIWVKNFLKSFKDIAKELAGIDTQIAVQADIISRENALNGKYGADTGKYGLGIDKEETYSTDLLKKIPGLGRLFKASEAAFSNGALRMRADIADMEIAAFETLGLDMMEKKNARSVGSLVASITGRGNIDPRWAKAAGGILWAPRLYKSQIDQLTAHSFDFKMGAKVRQRALKNLGSMIAAYAVIFSLAKLLDPESIDWKKQPGKIKMFGKWVDVTGGKGQVISLVNKFSTGMIKNLQGDPAGYGEETPWDMLISFANGKLNPRISWIRDLAEGKFYSGEKLSIKGFLKSRFVPISLQTFEDLKNDPEATNIVALMMLEAHGANVKSYFYREDWTISESKEMTAFREKLGPEKTKEANDLYNLNYQVWLSGIEKDTKYKSLSDDEKNSVKGKARKELKDLIYKKYNFNYKAPKETIKQKMEKKRKDKLLPKTLN